MCIGQLGCSLVELESKTCVVSHEYEVQSSTNSASTSDQSWSLNCLDQLYSWNELYFFSSRLPW